MRTVVRFVLLAQVVRNVQNKTMGKMLSVNGKLNRMSKMEAVMLWIFERRCAQGLSRVSGLLDNHRRFSVQGVSRMSKKIPQSRDNLLM
jgi:hypothetical protein